MNRRLFVAIPPEPETVAALSSWAETAAGTNGRAVPPERWHLTLAFFGSTPEEHVSEIRSALAELRFPSRTYVLDRWWLLPSPSDARVLAVGGEPVDDDLVNGIRSLQATNGWGDVERRPFLPHVTLARYRASFRGKTLAPRETCLFPARRFALFESRLDADGPAYRELASYPLC